MWPTSGCHCVTRRIDRYGLFRRSWARIPILTRDMIFGDSHLDFAVWHIFDAGLKPFPFDNRIECMQARKNRPHKSVHGGFRRSSKDFFRSVVKTERHHRKKAQTTKSHLTTRSQNSFEHFTYFNVAQQFPDAITAHAILDYGHDFE
jgi:hypothetical protein